MTSPNPTAVPSNSNDSLKPQRLSRGQLLSRGVLLLLVVGLCIVNVFLVKQNRDLKASIAGNQPDFLKPGEHVPSFTANVLSGERRMVNYAASAKTVLLVFTPGCPACERTLPYWKEIKAACDRKGYQIFGISLDNSANTGDYLKANGLNLTVFASADAQIKKSYKLNLTPLTIVIGNDGRVEEIWAGAFTQQSKQDVEKYFNLLDSQS